jgi:hypothetical protein
VIAEFQGMLDPKYLKTVIAKGPFIVEVYENPERPKYFRARLIPTCQDFFEMKAFSKVERPVRVERSTAVDVRILIEHRFQKKLQDWHEPNLTERPGKAANGNE